MIKYQRLWKLVIGILFVMTMLTTPVLATQLEENVSSDMQVEYVYTSEGNNDGQQSVILKLATKGQEIQNAILYYMEGDLEEQSVAQEISDEFATFLLEDTGVERVFSKVVIQTESKEETITLLAQEEKNIEFEAEEVQEVVQEVAKEEVSQEIPEVINSLEDVKINEEIVTANASSFAENEQVAAMYAKAGGKYIVVLDAGHGGSDGGAAGSLNGKSYNEKDFTLKIAQYTKQAIEARYSNITVYMTRTTDKYISLTDRVDYAAARGAHLFVSLHINSWTNPSVKGARIFIPNDSPYNNYTHTQSKLLAKEALKELTGLGFRNGGFYENDSTSSVYPDGSAADYYSVIRNSRRKGITGVIFEHGFISNPDDLAYLSKDANLRKIGEADAKAIGNYITANGDSLINSMGSGSGSLDPSTMPEGWNKVNGKWYYVTSQKELAKGWLKVKGIWYYLDESGVMQTGWEKVKGKWYYLNASGAMVTGWVKVGDKWYFMQESGAMHGGWLEWKGQWYFLDGYSGAMLKGWIKPSASWYYLGDDGVMRTGWVTLKGKKYYLKESGAMVTSWYTVDAVKYYFTESGAMAIGKQTIKDAMYYFDEEGKLLKGWIPKQEEWYYANEDGILQTGWITLKGHKYYLNSDGLMIRGWKKFDSKWYYFNKNGTMAKGWVLVKEKWYLLDEEGIMLTGWNKVKGKWYYLKSNGAMETGWLKEGGKTYYLTSNGSMQTGWLKLNKKWYYFHGWGEMKVGWLKLGTKWYYLKSNGVMAESEWIGTYYVDSNGVWDQNKKKSA